MAFTVEILGKGEPINLGGSENENSISKIEFIFDSTDDVKNKSFDAVRGLKITGKIVKENKKDTVELAKWALEMTGDGVYRKVNVRITDEVQESIREYEFDTMFVVDYQEIFEENNFRYEIILRQQAKKLGIKVLAI